MSKRPEPLKRCSCGAETYEDLTDCTLCGGLFYWVDLAAGLEHEAAIVSEMAELQDVARLLTDAAARLHEQDAQIESMQQAQGGAKERRQGLKAARLATVIQEEADTFCAPITPAALLRLAHAGHWMRWTNKVNQRYGARHDPPSDETKALVAQKFAQPQEVPSA